jgi:hypothetical protein
MDKGLHPQAKEGKDLLQEEKGHLLERVKSHLLEKGLHDHLQDNKETCLPLLQVQVQSQNALLKKKKMKILTISLSHGL